MNLTKLLDPESYSAFLRNRSIRKRLRKVGANVIFDPMSTFTSPETIELHDNVFVGERAHLAGEITIQRNVMFGARPVIVAGDHIFAVKGQAVRLLHPVGRETAEPIVVEEDAWCGACVLILGGVTIGTGAVVGAGSVVTKSIPPYTMAAGNYCRPFARLFNDETLVEHLVLLGRDKSEARRIVERRIAELEIWGMLDLRIVDKTEWYRGHSEAGS